MIPELNSGGSLSPEYVVYSVTHHCYFPLLEYLLAIATIKKLYKNLVEKCKKYGIEYKTLEEL